MIKWLVRVVAGLVVLIVLLVSGGAGYLWYQGSQAMNRADASGWFNPAPIDAPLSVFETTVAKAEFGDSWNQSGFPCRSVARLAGILTGDPGGGMPVSQRLASDIEYAEFKELSLESQFRRLALGCTLETGHNDTELLRIWLRRAYFGHDSHGAEAASHAAFHKPASELDQLEAAKLAALLYSPNLWTRKEQWDISAQSTLMKIAKYEWDGTAMKLIEPGDAR